MKKLGNISAFTEFTPEIIFLEIQVTSFANFTDLGVLGSFAETSEFVFFFSIDDDNLI